jgi:hypothetical protein
MGYTRNVYTSTCKAFPVQTTKAYEGARIQFHLFLNPSIRWRLVERFEPQPLNSQGEPRVTTGWAPDNLGTLEKKKKSLALIGK